MISKVKIYLNTIIAMYSNINISEEQASTCNGWLCTYVFARSSYWTVTICSGLPYVLLRVHSFLCSILGNG